MSKKSNLITAGLLIFYLLVIPLLFVLTFRYLGEGHYALVSTLLVIFAICPFFAVFEGKKPGTKEIALLAVMTALTAASRVAFFMVQNFKPLAAMVIITGIALGAESGFLVGALATLISNFYYGQGPWTPWQMLSFGLIGFLAGLLFTKCLPRKKWLICLVGGVLTFAVHGLITNTSTVLLFYGDMTRENLLFSFSAALPYDLIHGVSSVVFLFFLTKPMLEKIERLEKKYGLKLSLSNSDAPRTSQIPDNSDKDEE